jgi:hypothetical protein
MSCLSALAIGSPILAVTYNVPKDRDLVLRADAIILATAITSHAESLADGRVVTECELRVDETLKGDVAAGENVTLFEPGGETATRIVAIAGSPRYADGKRYLVFMWRNPFGEYQTWGFQEGQFEIVSDLRGRELLSRGGLFGFDEGTETAHVEKYRGALEFMTFVRAQLKSANVPARADYFIDPADVLLAAFPEFRPRVEWRETVLLTRQDYLSFYGGACFRWRNGGKYTMKYCCGTTPQPGYNGQNAIAFAVGQWSGQGTSVLLVQGPEAPGATNGLHGAPDGQNVVLFNSTFLPPGIHGIGGFQAEAATYNDLGDGLTYHDPTEVDVEISATLDGISSTTFNVVVTHEIGHTLGFRHSDDLADNTTLCSPSATCTTDATMVHFVPAGINGLRPYDVAAISTVYGTCTNPSISVQPTGSTINSGQSANLSVTAGGTGPTYQWYIGNPGTINNPVPGGTTALISVNPTTTTTYFVRVSGCSTFIDSNAATVTVNSPCTPPSISVQPAGSTITSGQSANLSVTASGTSPFAYQWYTGASGNTSSPIGGATNSSVMVSPTTTTSYWVRVTGQCAPPVDSNTATVTVAACVNPSISQQPGNVTINSGSSTQLSVGASGTGLTFQWYVGNPPSTLSPVAGGTFTSLNVSPSQTTNFWVRVTGQCGSPADSTAATVTVVCNPPAITQQPSSASITAGSSTLLTVGATGTSLTYQWYSGTAPDTTLPVAGGSSATIQVSPSQTTNFWVRVSGACGTPQNSTTATITVGACSSPVISGAAANPSNVLPGGSSQLSASVSGSVSGQPQWYIGTPPDKSHPVAQAGATVTVMPSANTTYWMQALSGCGAAAANSNPVTVTVGSSCINPTITIQPASETVIAGTTATLSVTVGGTAPLHYQWYQGPAGTKTTKVGSDSAFFTTDPVNSTTQLWVEVTNSCNGGVPAQSVTATLTPYLSRHRSTRH